LYSASTLSWRKADSTYILEAATGEKHWTRTSFWLSAAAFCDELVPIAAQVTVVHRRDRFGGHEKNIVRMKESSADVLTPYEVTQLYSGNGNSIERVTIT